MGGQVHVVPVVAFRLVRRRQPEEQQHDFGVVGGGDGLGGELWVAGLGLHDVSGGEGDLAGGADSVAQRGERVVEPGRG